MNLNISQQPARRGGHPASRPNTRKEARANQLATSWAGRDLSNQSKCDLEKTRDTLLSLGVSADTTTFNRPARLLAGINKVLASNAW